MKRTLALLLAVMMSAAALLTGCGSNSEVAENSEAASEADSEIAATVSEDGSKTFTVGFDAEFAPYGYKDEETGEYTGFDLDLAQEVCDRLGWKLVKQPIKWASKDMELNSGTISCIWNGFTMNGREDDYTWSSPYIDNSQVVVVKKDSDIKKLEDLKGKVVAVQADSSALAAFTGDDATKANKNLCASFADLQQVDNYNNALMNLDSGAVDAVCMDIGVASYNVSNNPDKYILLSDNISTEQYGIGFKKGNDALRDIVEDTLMDMVKDGKFEEIAKKYNLEDAICLGK